MLRKRLNFVARGILVVTAASAVLLMVAASLPPSRFFGALSAAVDTKQPIRTANDVPALYVRVIHPALVTFPDAWQVPNQFCMALHFDRGEAATTLNYDNDVPQSHWDDRPSDTMEVDFHSVRIEATDGSRLKTDIGPLVDQVTARTGFRVTWFGNQPIYLHKNESAGGLLCYYFYFLLGPDDVDHVPLDHTVGILARNVQVVSYPQYYLRYDPAPSAADPPALSPDTVIVPREDVMTFLGTLARQAPEVVAPLTPAERDRLATEIPPGS